MRARGSIYDVARMAGVSVSTVSRVFNKHPDAADATKGVVLEAAKKVNYSPRLGASRVSIGVVVEYIEPTHNVGLVSQLLASLARRMAAMGAVLEMVPIHDLDVVLLKHLRGLIAITYGPECSKLARVEHIPIVLINNRTPGPGFHYVSSDHAQGARLAVQHLVEQGHRRIGFIEIRKEVWGSMERERAYREVHSAAGLPVDPNLICYCENGPVREGVLRLWQQRPTAMLLCGEDLSLAANAVLLQELQLKVPEDLSVISCEMPLVSSILGPPQTTVAQPWDEISQRAVEGIFSLMQGGARGRLDVMLPSTLIQRRSVRDLRAAFDTQPGVEGRVLGVQRT